MNTPLTILDNLSPITPGETGGNGQGHSVIKQSEGGKRSHSLRTEGKQIGRHSTASRRSNTSNRQNDFPRILRNKLGEDHENTAVAEKITPSTLKRLARKVLDGEPLNTAEMEQILSAIREQIEAMLKGEKGPFDAIFTPGQQSSPTAAPSITMVNPSSGEQATAKDHNIPLLANMLSPLAKQVMAKISQDPRLKEAMISDTNSRDQQEIKELMQEIAGLRKRLLSAGVKPELNQANQMTTGETEKKTACVSRPASANNSNINFYPAETASKNEKGGEGKAFDGQTHKELADRPATQAETAALNSGQDKKTGGNSLASKETPVIHNQESGQKKDKTRRTFSEEAAKNSGSRLDGKDNKEMARNQMATNETGASPKEPGQPGEHSTNRFRPVEMAGNHQPKTGTETAQGSTGTHNGSFTVETKEAGGITGRNGAAGFESLRSSVSAQLFQGIHDTIRINRNRAVLHLNPPELGKVRVTLSLSPGNQLHATFIVDHPDTRQIVESSMTQLRQQLAENGFTAGALDVGIGHREPGQDFFSGFQQSHHAGAGSGITSTTEEDLPGKMVETDNRLLHVIA